MRVIGNGPKGNGTAREVEFEYTRTGANGLEGTGETFRLAADQVFKAIGQTLEGTPDGLALKGRKIRVDTQGRTSLAQVWAGGDCATGGDTLYRNQRARDLLAAKAGELTVADLQEALRDHAGYPLSICRHVDAERGNSGTASIASIVMDVGARTMYVASGPPCSYEYQTVTVPGAVPSAVAPQSRPVGSPA